MRPNPLLCSWISGHLLGPNVLPELARMDMHPDYGSIVYRDGVHALVAKRS